MLRKDYLKMIEVRKSHIIVPILIFTSAFLVRFSAGPIVMNDEVGYGRYWGYLEEARFIVKQIEQASGVENLMINFMGHTLLARYLTAFSLLLFPSLQDIAANLLVFSTLSSLTCILAYYIGKDFYGTRVGVMAGFFLAFNPLFINYGRCSYPHETLALFMSLSLLALYRGVSRNSSRYILLSSLFCGLAFSSHEFSILLPVIIAYWVLYLILVELRTRQSLRVFSKLLFRDKHLVNAMMYAATALSIYVALFPWLWPDPVARLLYIFRGYTEFSAEGHPIYFMGRVWFDGSPIYTYAVYIVGFTTLVELMTFVLGIVYLTKQIATSKASKEDILLILWFGTIFCYFSLMVVKFVHFSVIFFPPLSVVCGLGSTKLAETAKRLPSILGVGKPELSKKVYINTVCISLISLHIILAVSVHPYYEIYVSPMIGVKEGVRLFMIEAGGVPYKRAAEYLGQYCELNSNIVVGGAALIRYYLKEFNVNMIWDYDYYYHLQQPGIAVIKYFLDHDVKYFVFFLDWAQYNDRDLAYMTFKELEPSFVFEHNEVEWVWIYKVSTDLLK